MISEPRCLDCFKDSDHFDLRLFILCLTKPVRRRARPHEKRVVPTVQLGWSTSRVSRKRGRMLWGWRQAWEAERGRSRGTGAEANLKFQPGAERHAFLSLINSRLYALGSA